MKRLFTLIIPLSLLTLTGCVVVPGRGYYRPHAVVVAPAPVVVGGWYR